MGKHYGEFRLKHSKFNEHINYIALFFIHCMFLKYALQNVKMWNINNPDYIRIMIKKTI